MPGKRRAGSGSGGVAAWGVRRGPGWGRAGGGRGGGGRFRQGADRVLVEAPCTGLGTVGRRPEIRWHREPGDIPRLAALQEAILEGAAACVRPGGVLVYAVCSHEPEEAGEGIGKFVAGHADFALDEAAPGFFRGSRAQFLSRGAVGTGPDG